MLTVVKSYTYNYEQDKVDKIVEGMGVHHIVHDLHPPFQCDHLQRQTTRETGGKWTSRVHFSEYTGRYWQGCCNPRKARNNNSIQVGQISIPGNQHGTALVTLAYCQSQWDHASPQQEYFIKIVHFPGSQQVSVPLGLDTAYCRRRRKKARILAPICNACWELKRK